MIVAVVVFVPASHDNAIVKNCRRESRSKMRRTETTNFSFSAPAAPTANGISIESEWQRIESPFTHPQTHTIRLNLSFISRTSFLQFRMIDVCIGCRRVSTIYLCKYSQECWSDDLRWNMNEASFYLSTEKGSDRKKIRKASSQSNSIRSFG